MHGETLFTSFSLNILITVLSRAYFRFYNCRNCDQLHVKICLGVEAKSRLMYTKYVGALPESWHPCYVSMDSVIEQFFSRIWCAFSLSCAEIGESHWYVEAHESTGWFKDNGRDKESCRFRCSSIEQLQWSNTGELELRVELSLHRNVFVGLYLNGVINFTKSMVSILHLEYHHYLLGQRTLNVEWRWYMNLCRNIKPYSSFYNLTL